jgi:tripartite-type tricarboxylate transporter receptor subunit TctC
MGLRSLQLLIALVAIGPACAQDYPVEPIRAIVQAGAGARSTSCLGWYSIRSAVPPARQPTIVENRARAGGTHGCRRKIGTRRYAILAASRRLPTVLVTCPAEGQHTIQDLIAIAKAKPTSLTSPRPGVGSATHFSAEPILASAGVEAVHVPMREDTAGSGGSNGGSRTAQSGIT